MMNYLLNHWVKKLFLITFMVIGLALVVQSTPEVLAQGLSQGGGGLAIPTDGVVISSAISQRSFADTVLTMVNYFTGFLGFIATLALIYAGVLWIINGGNDELITKAKKIITYALGGIIIIILSQAIVRFVAFSGQGPVGTNQGIVCGNTTCNVGQQCTIDANNNPVCRDSQGFQPPVVGRNIPGSVTSSPSEPAVNSNIERADELIKGMEDDLDTSQLSQGAKQETDRALNSGSTLDQKISNIQNMINNPSQFGLTDSDVRVLGNFLGALERLKLLREELNDIQKTMPESKDILDTYKEASDTLDDLIDDPSNLVKFRRFEAKYLALKDLIRQFPSVEAKIIAYPGEGNVPFSVQLDGLDSVDPTGGTIAQYQWSYIDASGSEVVIGTEPVITYEFTTPNNYAIRLKVATSQKDDAGYKTAADGLAIVRIRANPPTSQVKFRVNGAEAQSIMTFTLQEALAGLSFDPSGTTAAQGRQIQEYKWSYGDGAEETRQVPSTVVHTYTEAGEYFVRLEVTDNLQVTDTRLIKLFIKSLAADIKISPSSGNVNTEFRFEGVRSRSDDGLIQSYDWEVRDASGQVVVDNQNQSFMHRFDRPGVYQISLTVTDVTGSKDQSISSVEVLSRDPVANFNFSIPENNHPNRVEFNAINSYDPDEGDQIEYSWDFDGDGTFEITKGSDALVNYEYSRVGEYRAVLQVEDGFGKRNSVEKNISIESVLSADIKTSQLAVKVGEPIAFEADNSNAVAYLWEFGDGETESTEKDSVEHTYDRTGKYTVKMNFFDKDDNDNYDTKRILVGGADEPLAVINYTVNNKDNLLVTDLCGANQDGMVVSRSDQVRFDGGSSINTDGSSRLLAYSWDFPGGESSSDRNPSYRFTDINQEGKCFSVDLVVRDEVSGELSSVDTVYFKVINEIPEITDFVINPTGTSEDFITPAKVNLKAVNARDNDGTIKKYRWWYYLEGFENQRMGLHSTSQPETSMTITSFGQPNLTNRYYFVVESIDNDGGVYNSEERFAQVSYLDITNGPNLSPVAEFTVDKTTISAGDSITFFSRSYDPQGEPLPNDAFRWDFDGDGAFDDTSSGSQVNRQYNTPGQFEARLRVVHRGLSSSYTQMIFVEPTESLPQPAFTYTVEGNTVNFDGTHTRFDPTLADPNLRFEWDFNTNEDANGNGASDDDVQSTDISPSFTYPEKAKVKVRLKATDSLGVEGVVVREIDLNLTEQERQQNTLRSVRLTAPRHPITTLDLEVVPSQLSPGASADIQARILNADNSVYTGKVFFEVIDGTGQFAPNPVDAKDSVAAAVFTAVDPGQVRIRVRATETLYGEISEEVTIEVR